MPDYSFTTDRCSGGMTTLWRRATRRDPPWNGCCIEHDPLYWPGGSAGERRMRCCSTASTLKATQILAWLMWAAVRLGGHPLLPFPWRWGYGWKYPRTYTA